MNFNNHKSTSLAFRVSALALVLTLAMTGVASADHFDGTCGDELNVVEQEILAANFMGRKAETDQDNMLAKLEAAYIKIGAGKFVDAADKLLDISDKATALATARKPKLEDATGINEAVIEALVCLGTQ
jgi:hypothetical protein